MSKPGDFSGLFISLAISPALIASGAVGYHIGRSDGASSVCKPENFPSGTIGHAIADCNAQDGYPNITYRGLFECTKRVVVKIK